MSSVKAIKLASGSMPQLGFGTWRSEPGKVKAAVQVAIASGYRHIDAAWIYGNEAEVGAGISESLKEHGLDRSSLWVTSKLWNNFHDPKHVRAACEESLRSLRLDYLDLYLSKGARFSLQRSANLDSALACCVPIPRIQYKAAQVGGW